jgi:hypothetical protein
LSESGFTRLQDWQDCRNRENPEILKILMLTKSSGSGLRRRFPARQILAYALQSLFKIIGVV